MNFNGISSTNLSTVTHDVKQASHSWPPLLSLPAIPSSKRELAEKIESMRCNLPAAYAADFWGPAKEYLNGLQEIELTYARFSSEELKQKYPSCDQNFLNRCARIRDFTQVVLQHSTNFQWDETRALQQFACDMWNTFVTASGYCSTGHCLSPLVKWGDSKSGPWALSQHHLNSLQLNGNAVPIVSFPLEYSQKGILAWIVLGHEMSHTILESGMKLSKPLSDAVWDDLTSPYTKINDKWANYWTDRVSEAAADVMSVLYMGPVAAIGLMIYLRSMRSDNKLANNIEGKDHPADTLRALVVAHVVKELGLQDSDGWFDYLQKQIRRDFDSQKIGLTFKKASYQASCVAKVIMTAPIVQGRSLMDIRCWNKTDEMHVRAYMRDGANLDQSLFDTRQFRTPHLVAAANLRLLLKENLSSLDANQRISSVFQQMIQRMNQEAERQKELGCKFCPPTQKNTYTVCSSSDDNSSDDMEKSLGIAALIFLGIVVIGGGVAILANNNSRKSGSGHRPQAMT